MNTPPAMETYSDKEAVILLDDDVRPATRRDRNARTFVIAVVAATLAAIAGWIVYTQWFRPVPPPELPAPTALTPTEPARPLAVPELPTLRHPLPEAPAGPPLPALADSDGAFATALGASLGQSDLLRWLIPQDLIRRIVVTVDNLPRKTVPRRMSPVKPVPGTFTVGTAGSTPVIAQANAERYAPFVRGLEAIDANELVAVYVRWYPRFQEAYRELGYPDGHFNDRLVEAIDTMLATPRTNAPLAVVQPKVLWEFADPRLEALPAGQKILLRMGPDNAERVKARLAEVRRLVASGAPR